MNDKLYDIYRIPEQVVEQDIFLEDLAQQCHHLEQLVMDIAQRLSPEDRQILEEYIHLRDDLDFHTAKVAMKYGKLHLY